MSPVALCQLAADLCVCGGAFQLNQSMKFKLIQAEDRLQDLKPFPPECSCRQRFWSTHLAAAAAAGGSGSE